MYDTLAEPVADPTGINRLFFAGEHTFRASPGSAPGAWLSGIRAAAEIADQFLGQPFVKTQKECVDLSDSEDEEMVCWLFLRYESFLGGKQNDPGCCDQ